MYKFTLPFPPSINGYRVPIGGRLILSKRGREYKKAALEAITSQNLNDIKIDSRLYVSIVMNYSTKRKIDLDNFVKPVLDSLTEAGFWVDDSQIDRLTLIRGEIKKPRMLTLTVEIEDER